VAVSTCATAGFAPGAAASGGLDPGFGAGGLVTADLGGYNAAQSVVVDEHRRTVAAGFAGSEGSETAVARFTRQGTLDPSFGQGGIARLSLADAIDVEDLALQPNGKILLVGTTFNGKYRHVSLTRLLTDGTPDATFGGGGTVITRIRHAHLTAGAVAAAGGGRILVAGADTDNHEHAAVLRYDGDGVLDTSFAHNGIKVLDKPLEARATGVTPLRHGKIALGGFTYRGAPLGTDRFLAARLRSSGRLDRSFSRDGRAVIEFPDQSSASAEDLALDANGRLVLGGWAWRKAEGGLGWRFAAARFRSSGRLDRSFAGDGRAVIGFDRKNPLSGNDLVPLTSVTALDHGRLVLTGTALSHNKGRGFAVAAVNRRGHLLKSFGDGGRLVTQFPPDPNGGKDEVAADSAALSGKRFVVAGWQGTSSYDEIDFDQWALAGYRTGP
jgi:uncharacterized delta-60 repeat protein